MKRDLAALLAAAAIAGVPGTAQAAPPAEPQHWVTSWAAAPSSASRGRDITDFFDASAHPKLLFRNQSVRVVVTPTYGGEVVRVRLSNRFGTRPVTFGAATVARSAGRAKLLGAALPLAFSGRASVTVGAGQEVVSDPAAIAVTAFERLAVSVFVAGAATNPTEHFMGRQTSYVTLPGAGNATQSKGGLPFLLPTTTRPYVAAVDVTAGEGAGTVVAFGDSLTDGYQSGFLGQLESRTGLDRDERYPDFLAQRLSAAGRSLAVANAGISGNRILHDGLDGTTKRGTFGPAALNRLGVDSLGHASVKSVIVMEGINDLGQSPGASPEQVIAGLSRLVDAIHAGGARVLLGTLTPAGGAQGAYGTDATDAARQQVNRWIREQAAADAVVDFDGAVRDPVRPSRIAAAFDGGDHLHFNPAGNRALANAVPLDEL